MSALSKSKLLITGIFLSQMVSGVSWALPAASTQPLLSRSATNQKIKIKTSMNHVLSKPDKDKVLAVSEVTIEGSKAALSFEDGTTKTIQVPKLIQSLNLDVQENFIAAVLNTYDELKVSGLIDKKEFITSIMDQFQDSDFEIIDVHGIETAANSIVQSSIYSDIGSTYVDVSVEINAMMGDFYDMVDSMMMGYEGEEWDTWKNGGGTTPDVNDTSSTSGTVEYGNGTTVTYTEDANGVRTYHYTSGDGTSDYTTDNDSDNNGYPDYNNDGGIDWPFCNCITPRSEGRAGRGPHFPFSASPEAQFLTAVQIEFYNQVNVRGLENMLIASAITKDQYQTLASAAFNKFLISDAFKNMRSSFEKATGIQAPTLFLNSIRFQ